MAQGLKAINFDKEQLLAFLPLILSLLAIIFILFVLILPQGGKVFSLSKELGEKRSALIQAERGLKNFEGTKKEIVELEKKIAEMEKRLPKQIEATLLIDTLKDITEEAKLKFSSIEPMAQKDYELKGQEEFYVELPIRVKLKCNYMDLLKFIQKIEHSSRLMKIRELAIKNNLADIWEHNVELIISTYATSRK